MACTGIQVQPGCCGNCTVFSDNFDRTGAVGSNWSAGSGSWSCATTGGGQLTTSSANAEITQAVGGYANKAQATVSGSGQLQVGLTAGGGYYFAAELDTGAGTFSIVTGSTSGGSRAVLRSCSAGDSSATIALCSDTYPYGSGSTIRTYTAFLNGTPMLSWGDSIADCESFSGVLATGSLSGTATFTAFTFSSSACGKSGCPACSQCCFPLTSDGELPSTAQVVVSGIGGAATTLGDAPCTDAQCATFNGTYLLDLADTSDCSASYTGCPDLPVCACYELTDLDLSCDSVSPYPVTTIKFMAFNSDGGSCQGPGQCNLYVQFSISGGFVVFYFDLGLGAAPGGFDPSKACGTYSTTDGCSNSATLYANTSQQQNETFPEPTPGGLRCRHDTLDDLPSATAVVSFP